MKSLILAAVIGAVAVGGAAVTRSDRPARPEELGDQRQAGGPSVTLVISANPVGNPNPCIAPGTYGPYPLDSSGGTSWGKVIVLPARNGGSVTFAIGITENVRELPGVPRFQWSFYSVPAGGACGTALAHDWIPAGTDPLQRSFTSWYHCLGTCSNRIDVRFSR